jgi:hypothetical protein
LRASSENGRPLRVVGGNVGAREAKDERYSSPTKHNRVNHRSLDQGNMHKAICNRQAKDADDASKVAFAASRF